MLVSSRKEDPIDNCGEMKRSTVQVNPDGIQLPKVQLMGAIISSLLTALQHGSAQPHNYVLFGYSIVLNCDVLCLSVFVQL